MKSPNRFSLPEPQRAPIQDDAPLRLPPELQSSVDRLAREERRRARVALVRRAIDVLINVAFFGLVTFTAALLLYWATDRTPPVTIALRLLTPRVTAGQRLKLLVTPNRLRICQGRVTFTAFDGEDSPKSVMMDWQWPTGGLGPDKSFERTITIPSDAVPGTARLRITREFRCPLNPIHWWWPITETTPDLPFQIVAPARRADGHS